MKIKGLTKANIAKLGIELAPERGFEDDGNYFRGFIYKGMPLTQCRSDGQCYLTIRDDYLENNYLWDEWRDAGGWELTDRFNGVAEFDTEDLIDTIEKVIKLRDELNERYSAPLTEKDWSRLEERLNNEALEAQKVVERAKVKIEWWKLDDYSLRRVKDAMKTIDHHIEWKTLDRIKKMNLCNQRDILKTMERGKALIDVNYYINILNKAMGGESI